MEKLVRQIAEHALKKRNCKTDKKKFHLQFNNKVLLHLKIIHKSPGKYDDKNDMMMIS